MSKQLFILLFFTVLVCNCYSQDSVLLRVTYLPKHIYHQTASEKNQTVLSYSGSDSLLNVLKEKGIENPTKQDAGKVIKSIITTGTFDSKNKMPVELEFLKAEDLDGKSIIPPGTRLIGSTSNNQVPIFDSIVSENMDDQFKTSFLAAFRNVLSQFELPNKKIALGDKYIQTTPFNIPIGPIIPLKMNIEITYTLLNLNDSLANFDIAMKFTMDMNVDKSDASGSGNGTGTMVYDRINQFPVKNETNLIMDLKMDRKLFSLQVVLQSNSANETIISMQ